MAPPSAASARIRRADRVLAEGALGPGRVRALADALVLRHALAARASAAAPDAAHHARALEADLAVLRPRAGALGEDVLDAAQAHPREFLRTHADVFLARAGAGRVLARAEPLRLARVVVSEEEGVWVTDAAEAPRVFEATGPLAAEPVPDAAADPDAERRAASPGDVCTELAGLSVELLAAGRAAAAEALIAHYAGEADDFELYALIAFHEGACAIRRAAQAVDAAHATGAGADAPDAPEDAALAEARRLLALAACPARRPAAPPLVVAMAGQVASGKSTLATALADALGAPRVVADRVRDGLLHETPGDPLAAGGAAAPGGGALAAAPGGAAAHGWRRASQVLREAVGRVSREARGLTGGSAQGVHEAEWTRAFAPGFHERVYAELLRRAELALASGRPVVLDACFPSRRERDAVRALAARHGAAFRLVECVVDMETQAARLAARDAEEEEGAPWQMLAGEFAQRWSPPQELPAEAHLQVGTARPLEASLAELLARLPAWPGGPHAQGEGSTPEAAPAAAPAGRPGAGAAGRP